MNFRLSIAIPMVCVLLMFLLPYRDVMANQEKIAQMIARETRKLSGRVRRDGRESREGYYYGLGPSAGPSVNVQQLLLISLIQAILQQEAAAATTPDPAAAADPNGGAAAPAAAATPNPLINAILQSLTGGGMPVPGMPIGGMPMGFIPGGRSDFG